MMSIRTSELRRGDVWVGEDGFELHITYVEQDPDKKKNFIPWGAPANSIPVPMTSVLIRGILWRGNIVQHEGQWTLQPDMPVEIKIK